MPNEQSGYQDGGGGCSWRCITVSHLEKGAPFPSQSGLFQQGEPQVGANLSFISS